MSTGATPSIRRPGGEAIVLAVLAVLAVGFAWYLTRDREVPLETSAMGHQGVVAWLKAEGIEARYATGPVEAKTIGLRILPVLDTDLRQDFVRPETREEYLKTGTEIDLWGYFDRDEGHTSLLTNKIERIPSLVIAPKWMRAVRHSGYAHPSLLLPADQPARALESLVLFDGDVRRSDAQLRDYTVGFGDFAGDITLYAPQFLPKPLHDDCQPVIDTRDGVLLAKCTRGKTTFHVLIRPRSDEQSRPVAGPQCRLCRRPDPRAAGRGAGSGGHAALRIRLSRPGRALQA